MLDGRDIIKQGMGVSCCTCCCCCHVPPSHVLMTACYDAPRTQNRQKQRLLQSDTILATSAVWRRHSPVPPQPAHLTLPCLWRYVTILAPSSPPQMQHVQQLAPNLGTTATLSSPACVRPWQLRVCSQLHAYPQFHTSGITSYDTQQHVICLLAHLRQHEPTCTTCASRHMHPPAAPSRVSKRSPRRPASSITPSTAPCRTHPSRSCAGACVLAA
jgi:hypothetical protein